MKNRIFLVGLLALTIASSAWGAQVWTCDGGFKSSLGGGIISQLKQNTAGQYELWVGSSPSDVGELQTVEPLKIIDGLRCKFSTEHNGQIVKCSNDQMTGNWFELISRYDTSTELDENQKLNTSEYISVIISTGDPKIGEVFKKITGDQVVRYNVPLDLSWGKCGLEKHN